MHGRLKVKTTAEKEEERRKELQKKAEKFQAATKLIFAKRAAGNYDDEVLTLTSQVLSANPDFSTVWNYRREILLKILDDIRNPLVTIPQNPVISDEENKSEPAIEEGQNQEAKDKPFVDDPNQRIDEILERELDLTVAGLHKNPKSYSVWHQRQWIILNMKNPDLQREIALCGQMLALDERNFHCWDYRRWVSKLAKVEPREELEFTLNKIKDNFSNFSAWFYRSSVYELLEKEFTEDDWKSEYDLVQNALFTDPSDQSAWFYHRWLMMDDLHAKPSSEKSSASNDFHISRVILDTSYNKIIVSLKQAEKDVDFGDIWIQAPDSTKIASSNVLKWHPLKGTFSNIWHADFSLYQLDLPEICLIMGASEIQLLKLGDLYASKEHGGHLSLQASSVTKLLDEEKIENLKTLQDMEPENKWVNLALSTINKETSVFQRLMELDPSRINYYKDQLSKHRIAEYCSKRGVVERELSVNLSSMNLGAFYFVERFIHVRSLDLSGNEFTNLGRVFNSLMCLEQLNLNDNKIQQISSEFKIPHLKILWLKNNRIKTYHSFTHLKQCTNLRRLYLDGNPVVSSLQSLRDQEQLLNIRDIADVFAASQ